MTFTGAWLSLNKAYSSHYHVRNQEKDRYKLIFTRMLLGAQVKPLQAFTLTIRYNSRMDCDNVTGGVKSSWTRCERSTW